MDTKLKSRHKTAVILILFTIISAATIVLSMYPSWYMKNVQESEGRNSTVVASSDFLEKFIEASYVLYNLETEKEIEGQQDRRTIMWENRSTEMRSFESFEPYLEYRVEDENETLIARSSVNTGSGLTDENMTSTYPIAMILTYDHNGEPQLQLKQGEYATEQIRALKEILAGYFSEHSFGIVESYNPETDTTEKAMIETPKDRTYMFAMTQDNLQDYLWEWYGGESMESGNAMLLILCLVFIVAALAWVFPLFPSFATGNEKIFHAPLEVVLVLGFTVFVAVLSGYTIRIGTIKGEAEVSDYTLWIIFFAVMYWVSSCMRQVYVLGGIRPYLQQRTIIYTMKDNIKNLWSRGKRKVKDLTGKIYHSLESIDLSEKNTQTIFKIVAVNFVILSLICSLWVAGTFVLIIYSVALFILIRKYFRKVQGDYQTLLKATNAIAEGKLDIQMKEDLGVFNSFKDEMEQIQKGFKKAVDEEVKSQRMKTELITNVSHDLKTPLTAIITYVDLLKTEKDEEKKKEYIQILESKSLRLKVLIEDLFEISKASSKNVNLHIMDVDVVHLFKQVKLEMDDKIKDTGLEFRCDFPEEKVIAPLDSQKTYRVFENLLSNIVKYALPNTRVYIAVTEENENVVIRMKNVSAAELKYEPKQLTERFVRGDVSRNTEGSGLGLAIAKSFVELQKGEFKIETEADLFKVEVKFRR